MVGGSTESHLDGRKDNARVCMLELWYYTFADVLALTGVLGNVSRKGV